MHLGTAGLDRFGIVGLGGAGGAAAAVTAGAPAQQHNDIAGRRTRPHHILFGRGADHCADLHTLGHIPGVVQLSDLAGGQSDLVAVAAVTLGSAGRDLPLGQLGLQGVCKGGGGIAGAGNPHGLVHIGAPAQRVTNGAAQAGGRATEGLNLRGVVVGLVLKLPQPLLGLAVHRYRYFNGAGVDLLALVQIVRLALGLQIFGADAGHIHQANVFVFAGIQGAAHIQVQAQGVLYCSGVLAFLHGDLVQLGRKGGVAAVVGPVGVNHFQLR